MKGDDDSYHYYSSTKLPDTEPPPPTMLAVGRLVEITRRIVYKRFRIILAIVALLSFTRLILSFDVIRHSRKAKVSKQKKLRLTLHKDSPWLW